MPSTVDKILRLISYENITIFHIFFIYHFRHNCTSFFMYIFLNLFIWETVISDGYWIFCAISVRIFCHILKLSIVFLLHAVFYTYFSDVRLKYSSWLCCGEFVLFSFV